MITKEKLIERIQSMPEERFTNLEDVLEAIVLLDKIESSMLAEAKGEVLTEEELDKLVSSW